MKGHPIDSDRNWSLRFFGETKEFHDTLMRLLDESVEDTASEGINFSPFISEEDASSDYSYSPTDPTYVIDASPSEIEESAATDSSDDYADSSPEISMEERVFAVRGGRGSVQDDEEAPDLQQQSHFISDN